MCFGRSGIAKSQISLQIGVKQHRVLWKVANELAETLQTDLANVEPINPNNARLRIIESCQQFSSGALARAVGANDGNTRGWLNEQTHVTEYAASSGIIEADIHELNFAVRISSQDSGARMLCNGGAQIERFHHSPNACSDPLQSRIKIHSPTQRFKQTRQICIKRNKAPNREAPVEILFTSHSQNDYCP